jgi:hypothetical protein
MAGDVSAIPQIPQPGRAKGMGRPVGRVLYDARGVAATIHLRRPLPVASSGPPAHSGGPPSNVRAPGARRHRTS